MSITALKEYTRYAKYAKHIKSENRRETWGESVDRMFDMHIRKYTDPKTGELPAGLFNHLMEAKKDVLDRKILGSQRALQFGGDPILAKNARLYNCCGCYASYPKVFQDIFWLLLCGCGVGISVQQHHVAQLPNIKKRTRGKKVFVAPDTIEGWSDCLGVLMSSYFNHLRTPFPEYCGYEVEFDLSLIRPEGAPLSFGGKAPGPEGLRYALQKIEELIERVLSEGKTQLEDIDVYDIICHASDAVLSGGVRRSALLIMFTHTSEKMYNAKIGNWSIENPQRGRSNNSALLVKGEVTREEFHTLIKSTKDFGEPGFLWAESREALFNPCVEIQFFAYWQNDGSPEWEAQAAKAYKICKVDGVDCLPGVQMCNLSEQNMRRVKTPEDLARSSYTAAVLGTVQAGYTDFDYLGPVSEMIVRKEALLGVSMTGMMDCPEIAFDPEQQRKAAKIVKDTNKEIAAILGINPAARTTCVKPSGSASCLLGSSSGIHPHHSKRYIRRVQANVNEFPAQYFAKINPLAVERSVWSASGTDLSVMFMCEVPDGSKTKNMLPAIDFLEHVRLTQINWVAYGRNKDLCTKPWLQHNVSNTVVVKPEEWDEVEKYIFENQKYFAGISLLPYSGDLDFAQAPFCNVETPQEILKEYGEATLLASGLISDAEKLWDGDLWKACATAMGIGEDLDADDPILDTRKIITRNAKKKWIERVYVFGVKYCPVETEDGNGLDKYRQIRRVSHLLKKVHLWKVWCDLKREWQEIDWNTVVEVDNEDSYQDYGGACDGAACEYKPFIESTTSVKEKSNHA